MNSRKLLKIPNFRDSSDSEEEMQKKELKVKINGDVYRACYHHALSTQSQEIVGLLIGQVEDNVINISALKIVKRLDKKKDRVEISDEQMMEAMLYSDHLKTKYKRPECNIVGWYHSHPHITVWPSHVDLKTQFNYQRMSEDWIGLIFAVYNKEKVQYSTRYELVAFQAKLDDDENLSRITLPIEIVNNGNCMSSPVKDEMVKLSDILLEEIKEGHSAENTDYLSALKRDLGEPGKPEE